MALDPTKPANNSPILSAELRSQFNALNDDLQQRALSIDVQDSINAQAAALPVGLPPPTFTVSNPPTQAEVQALLDYLNALYTVVRGARFCPCPFGERERQFCQAALNLNFRRYGRESCREANNLFPLRCAGGVGVGPECFCARHGLYLSGTAE